MNFESKLPNVGTTIFTIMSQLAVDHKAINLGQGFPDFSPDETLLDLVTQAMKEGHNQYPPMAGVVALRQQIALKVQALYGHQYDPETEITVTSGASEALMASILAFVRAGDEVIVIEPFYDLYIPVIELAGGKPVIVPMTAPTPQAPAYRVDWQRVRDAITSKTRMLILNFPHNPTCINLTPADLDSLESIVQETGILLLSDEVYEHLVYDDQPHQSVARRPLLAAHSIVVSSFGKTYSATGWKIGYCCAPKVISAEIRKVHQFNVFTVTSPMQVALAHYMKNEDAYLSLPAFYQQKRDRLLKGLANTRFVPMHSEGTFFLMADYSNISDLPEAEFARWITVEHGVGVIPVSAFYRQPDAPESNHGLIRFCFAKRDETLDTAIEKLAGI
ncbi:methionine aminotransferase [Pollutimonas harenae]|uniref:Aminotransferase class I/II-fold pyridoxal phosphate-dependent enzyme n=1 Tax=Pollutimonas harenae TaxID=657015 RepID=A0A853GZZ6_9BURK|nr:methionine aminotransferase [Pollutimonas harenae]NYT84615.1 aminotransferase class I/II-fold pyridoxal phosphate-dependent enzyme [Pollutimonas harenae]TEA72995.1 aminotransferase class I/II-fold pyridoxal phosphate-dependent enzyme [Pollutimonas harenae]